MAYAALHNLAGRVRDYVRLQRGGRGERVGLCMTKSIDAVAVIFGVLKAGAAPSCRAIPTRRHRAMRSSWRIAKSRLPLSKSG